MTKLIIDQQTLEEMGACSDAYVAFGRLFPDGVDVLSCDLAEVGAKVASTYHAEAGGSPLDVAFLVRALLRYPHHVYNEYWSAVSPVTQRWFAARGKYKAEHMSWPYSDAYSEWCNEHYRPCMAEQVVILGQTVRRNVDLVLASLRVPPYAMQGMAPDDEGRLRTIPYGSDVAPVPSADDGTGNTPGAYRS